MFGAKAPNKGRKEKPLKRNFADNSCIATGVLGGVGLDASVEDLKPRGVSKGRVLCTSPIIIRSKCLSPT